MLSLPERTCHARRTLSRNGARIGADLSLIPVRIPKALEQAIDTMDASDLRTYVKLFCRTNKVLRCGLEQRCLVPGKEVVRYHADPDSEDDQDSQNESSEDEEDGEESTGDGDSGEDREPRKKLKPIEAADDEMVPRNAKCLNCGEEFDVSYNERGDCRWHTGTYSSVGQQAHDEGCALT
jgi:hypothetical protein